MENNNNTTKQETSNNTSNPSLDTTQTPPVSSSKPLTLEEINLKIEKSKIFKEKGNKNFAESFFLEALQNYTDALQTLNSNVPKLGDVKKIPVIKKTKKQKNLEKKIGRRKKETN